MSVSSDFSSRSTASNEGHSGTPACVVDGEKVEQAADLQQAFDVVVVRAIGDARFGGVHRSAAELLRGHHLVGHGLHHVGTGDEHVAGVAHHEDEIGHRRRIDVAARARPHDDGNLRDHAGGEDVALEHLAVAAERRHAFLDAGAAGIEQADDGRARLHRHVLDLDDLLRVRLGQRAAEHGEILGEGEHRAAVDRAPAGDDAVAGNLCCSPCRSRPSGARRTCRTPRTSPCPSTARAARVRSACRACAARRCASGRRRRARARGVLRASPGCPSWPPCLRVRRKIHSMSRYLRVSCDVDSFLRVRVVEGSKACP